MERYGCFAGLDDHSTNFDSSKIAVLPIPYDGTSTWIKGADKGPLSIIEASAALELYDIETDSEVYKRGIHILPEVTQDASPELMYQEVYQRSQEVLEYNKFPTFFGGEHSISIGIIKAFYEKYPDITILQLDAHADLRPEYDGTRYNHACALHEASLHTNLIQLGIRSMDSVEKPFLNSEKCFFAESLSDNPKWMDQCLDMIPDKVYITIDLDVFDRIEFSEGLFHQSRCSLC